MNKKIICSILAALMSLFGGFLAAETLNYQIELIIFSQSWPNTEVLDQDNSKIEWPNDLAELSTYPKAEQLSLTANVAALSKNSAYRPILHSAWIQPIEDISPGKAVHIRSEDGKINGYLQVQRGQTLQLMTGLEYSPGQVDNNGEPKVYRINEKRKLLLNDTNYFDHPMFGAITQIKLQGQ